MTHRFRVIPGAYAVARLAPSAPIPAWALESAPFATITRNDDELSIVCPEERVPDATRAERGWALLKLHGPFPFDQVGVLASVTAPLAAAGVALFAISTFDTDYLLVKRADLGRAVAALVGAGHLEV